MTTGELQNLYSGEFQLIKVEKVGEHENVALITLNRPKALNALNVQLMRELSTAIRAIENDDSIRVVVLTGSEKCFAAGADIKEMEQLDFQDIFQKCENHFNDWDAISKMKKPIIAAVNGIALGGGTELALMCDVVYAGESAQFGQPEVQLGTIPGLGGTQRWPRFAGKSIAMEICLSGDRLDAQDAKQAGIVSKVFPNDQLVSKAINLAERIAKNSPITLKTVKESINSAYETSLESGLHTERLLFQSTFATEDRKEGMNAFITKRAPKWSNQTQ
ncbi:unnamed protein product [Caenorhabditis bovis]|uniref:Probable enoyl-CoA hydratase, mitochondrial n=1 Tax=Caenorhabditis bovis TaxID=2654633 RepID=A0A8S1EZM8_9PELO|nr:unnamed protein product [Caenorhabditis bovis]